MEYFISSVQVRWDTLIFKPQGRLGILFLFHFWTQFVEFCIQFGNYFASRDDISNAQISTDSISTTFYHLLLLSGDHIPNRSDIHQFQDCSHKHPDEARELKGSPERVPKLLLLTKSKNFASWNRLTPRVIVQLRTVSKRKRNSMSCQPK